MDEILSGSLILVIFLAAAAIWDSLCFRVPMHLVYFAFFGRIIFMPHGALSAFAASGAVCLAAYFISWRLHAAAKINALGDGDIFIIFIMGAYLDFWIFMRALFISCFFALGIAAAAAIFLKTRCFPLAPAFLFGTLAALW